MLAAMAIFCVSMNAQEPQKKECCKKEKTECCDKKDKKECKKDCKKECKKDCKQACDKAGMRFYKNFPGPVEHCEVKDAAAPYNIAFEKSSKYSYFLDSSD